MEIMPNVENLAIMLTEKCNHNCYHCFRPVTNLPSSLKLETLLALADKVSGTTIKSVRFTGGEPILYPKIEDLVQAFASKGLRVSIGTNATLLDSNRIRLLKDNGLEEIWTSIHSQNAGLHDQLAGVKGAFQKTVKAIDLCMREGLKVCVNFPVSKYNRYDLLPTVSFLMNMLVTRIKVLKITPMGKAGDGAFEHLTPDEWRSVVADLSHMDTKGFDIKVQGCSPISPDEGKCGISPIMHLNINPLGKIYPCCLLNNSSLYEIGDISDLLNLDLEQAIHLFNRRIKDRLFLSGGQLPCIESLSINAVCPLYSRHLHSLSTSSL